MSNLTKEHFESVLEKALKQQTKALQRYTDKKVDDLALMIQNNVAMKEDLKALERRTDQRFNELDRHLKEKATTEGLRELENKLIEDTGAVTGVEQKHNRSLTQRVTRLEKEVFPKMA